MQLDLLKIVDAFCKENNITYYLIAGSCLGAVRHGGFIPWDDDIDIALMRTDYEKFVKLFVTSFPSEKYFLQNYDSDKHFIPALSRICIKGTFVDVPSEAHLRNCKNTYIDVFPLDNVPDDITLREKQMRKLKKIDTLIGLKEYHLYDKSWIKKFVKKTISMCLAFLPLSYLQQKRVKVMSTYANKDTKCVSSTTSKYGYYKQIMDKSIYGVPVRRLFEEAEYNVPEKTEEYLKHLYGANYMQLPPDDKRAMPHKVFIEERLS